MINSNMIKILEVKVVNGVPTVDDVSISPSALPHLIVWHLVDAAGWFETLDFDPQDPPPEGIFGHFHACGKTPWAVMTDTHRGRDPVHDPVHTWSYTLKMNLAGKEVPVRSSPRPRPRPGGGANPNIKNN